jgi:hypothetical protein
VLDAVEGNARRVASYHDLIAQTTPLPWIADVARANAELTRAVARVYVDSGRKLLRV